MNRKLTILGLGLCVAAGASLSSCGGMWLDSGGMGVSIYDDYGPYWQPAPPPPPSYGSLLGPAWEWDGPVSYPGVPGPPPAVNRPAHPKPGPSSAPVAPRPPQNNNGGGINGGRPAAGLPSNPNLSGSGSSVRPSSGHTSGGNSGRPTSGASGRH